MNHYINVIKKYAVFSGRSSRAEYWSFVALNILFLLILNFLDNALGTTFDGLYGILSLAYALFVFVPGLAVAVRRLHDIGKSGWMLLVGFIPLAGPIWLFILMVSSGTNSENKFGPKSTEIASGKA